MAEPVINLLLTLIKNMAVVIVMAYVLTRTRFYTDILNKKFTIKNQALLILIFGLFSIYGTLSGMNILGAIANIRDLGPAIAGLVGGPLAGLGAGLIGAAHRYPLGGITAVPCALSTIIAGLAGGVIFKLKKDEFIGIYGAVIFAALMESLHMGLVLLVSRPYDQALAIVKQVSLPMILANSLGMAVFAFIVSNLIRERNTEAVKEMIESELKVAREIQMSIVPKVFPPFPDRPEFDIYALLEPAKEVGGDLYDFFFIDDEQLCFVIGDVSGKGVPASLFMAVTKTLIKTKTGKEMTPGEILFSVNNELCRDNDSGMFVTVFLGILNIRTGEVRYSNGGHNPPYLFRGTGVVELLKKTGGMALGVMENIPYEKNKIVLKAGDGLLLYTDGVTEAMDTGGNLFTEQRLEEVLRRISGASPEEMIRGVLAEIEKYAKGAEQSDDITIMALKYMFPGQEMSLEIKNDLAQLERVAQAVEEFGKTHHLPLKTIFEVNLALEEVLTNVISYGYSDDNRHLIMVHFSLKEKELEIEIIDDGRPFNPLELPPPDLKKPLAERPVGGLGIHLVRNLVDELDYQRWQDKNILVLRKNKQ